MTELQKYEAVNKCETLEELANVIESFADSDGLIQGKSRKFPAKNMADFCRKFELSSANALTREFGIRQQAMYIAYYEGKL